MKFNLRHNNIVAVTAALMAVLLAACASMGRPEGGPRDYRPPVFVRSVPAPGALNVAPKRMEIFFDENVELDDAFNKVIVSPSSASTPVVRALGHKVTVEFRDTLLPATTYTVDFGDAIKDLNEGNILDGFALDFSTGNDIDTLRISGMLFEARTLEPAQGMTVAVTSNLSDTAMTSVPFERVARTNQLGQFTVRNLKPGQYRVYAVNDVNRDRLWDRSEDVAFLGTVVSPSSRPVMLSDTLRSSAGTDSVVSRAATRFTPDDIVLMWFNEDFRSQYIKDHQRPERRRLVINMGAPSDSLPSLTIAEGPLAGKRAEDFALLANNLTNDSLTYWITDPKVIATDTLRLAIRHLSTDSLQNIVWTTDTIPFIYKEPKQNKKDKNKDEAAADSVPPVLPLTLQMASASAQDLRSPAVLRLPEPIGKIDSAKWHFETLVDTTWTALAMPQLEISPTAPLTERIIRFDWQPGAKYRLLADSAAMFSVYDIPVKDFKAELTAKKLEDYANLRFSVTPPDDTPYIVELLDGNDKPVRIAYPDNSNQVLFDLVTPGTYFARLFFDTNNDGKWTTGNVADKLQPEETAYFPKKIELRANWDNELQWDPYQLPLDQQKPAQIKKNKPKLKKGEKAPDATDEETDEWGNPLNGTNRGSNSFGGFGGFGNGSLQQSSGTSAPTLRR